MSEVVYAKVVCLEPVTHGAPGREGEDRGNEMPLRRVPVCCRLDDGSIAVEEVPAVSGNSIRGSTRRVFVRRILEVLGLDGQNGQGPRLDRRIAYFLLAGGTTGKGESASCHVLDLVRVYDQLPFVELLGGSIRGVFFEGRLMVRFCYPVVRETMPLFGKSPFRREFQELVDSGVDVGWRQGGENGGADDKPPRAEPLTARMLRVMLAERGWHRFTQARVALLGESPEEEAALTLLASRPDVEDALRRQAYAEVAALLGPDGLAQWENDLGIASEAGAAPEARARAIAKMVGALLKGEAGIFGVEAIPAGTVMHTAFALKSGRFNPLLVPALHAFCECFQQEGRLGGQSGKGFGLVQVEMKLADGTSLADASRAPEFWSWLKANRDEIVRFLTDGGDGEGPGRRPFLAILKEAAARGQRRQAARDAGRAARRRGRAGARPAEGAGAEEEGGTDETA